jgi:inorganic pyrophosphatase
VLSDEPMFPGCEVECRLVGVIKAMQKEKGKGKENHNDRLIAVPEGSVLYAVVKELADLNQAVLSQVEAFFTNYQRVRNIEFKVIERGGPAVRMNWSSVLGNRQPSLPPHLRQSIHQM